ncbi:5-(carboxyamino)imidazole ribonucleotide synthase [Pleurocapsa sp. CCALA 161]|uniref:5-(carboxyamino)imidazole ribonucleotide synthase n=1 Tax=Pleurocapsa sp. CCALA 161 TaxID=2107688 RepID=UPI001E5C724E|nr:5-(carboxyamino)imidazole ribonucleotide synthase [Pleurocapsa sp. CCALA 161]
MVNGFKKQAKTNMVGKRVGVIGGGQLAWMMALEAPALSIDLIVQAESETEPAVKIAKQFVIGNVDDAIATNKMAQMCDVITFENEFVDLKGLQELNLKEVFKPSLNTLKPLLDKYHQRSFLQQVNLPVPQFSLWSSQEQVIADYGFPLVLKARRHGYDGQGTFIIKDLECLQQLAKTVPVTELLVEEFVPFERELGIIAARNEAGEIAIYPVTETFQQNQVCHWTITPADVPKKVAEEVKAIAHTILDKLEVIGVFGIEFFLTADNRVLVNEIAPRTHNSGHYTLDGCETSQFTMQLQALTGLPLGSTELKSAGAIMVNLLGFEESDTDYLQKRSQILQIPNSFLHWYGKTSRPGRKLGHVTVILDEKELTQAKSIIEQIESLWYGE